MFFLKAPPRAILSGRFEEGLIFEVGDTIRLKLNFCGRPKPEIVWFHENIELVCSERCEIETLNDSSTIKIIGATRDDRGEYYVKLQNPLGEDDASFLVTVASMYLFMYTSFIYF